MTKQEAFDASTGHLIRQARKSANTGIYSGDTTQCLYRGPDGSKCAVGALLTDEEVEHMRLKMGPDFNSKRISVVVRYCTVPSLAGLDVVFLCSLQDIHDNNAVRDWPGALRFFAKKYGLRVDAVDAALAENPEFPK